MLFTLRSVVCVLSDIITVESNEYIITTVLLQHLIRRHSGSIEGKRVFEYCVLEYAE